MDQRVSQWWIDFIVKIQKQWKPTQKQTQIKFIYSDLILMVLMYIQNGSQNGQYIKYAIKIYSITNEYNKSVCIGKNI